MNISPSHTLGNQNSRTEDCHKIERFATQVEVALFSHTSNEEEYKKRVRTLSDDLQLSSSDKLYNMIVSGQVSPLEIVEERPSIKPLLKLR